ncbi:MAG: EF-Tu/IF-2/RF-3 family GTPase [Clostridia bacterium]
MVHPTLDAVDKDGNRSKWSAGRRRLSQRSYSRRLWTPSSARSPHFKINSGILRRDDPVVNVTKDAVERMNRLYVMRGKEQIEVPEIHAGDIGAVTKLSVTTTGDTLCGKRIAVNFPPIQFPDALMCMAVEPKSKGDEDKVSASLQRLMEEDPTIRLVVDREMETETAVVWCRGSAPGCYREQDAEQVQNRN